MNSKTALITGASVGIGRATAIALAGAGYNLILLARRKEKLQELAAELSSIKTYIIGCDINDHEELEKQLSNLPQEYIGIDLLVNNAGLALGLEPANETDWNDWQTMIETNCLSLAFITRQILPGMVERNRGHVINIGSTAGSYQYRGGNVYGASKAFVDQFSMNLLTDLLGTKVRSTLLTPGMLGDTEFSLVRFHGDESEAEKVYAGHQALKPEDVAESIRWVATQPEHVNINRLEIMPTCQAPAGLAVKS
ncbi:UNVERIFIED_CONTAM: hypothetical protein GTU68_010220 [Idotea baltica]|nr:hypothetical protein [Idotea baltica]